MNAVTETQSTLDAALDRPIAVTFFKTEHAKTKRGENLSLRDLAWNIQKRSAASKGELEWLKLATFGDQKTEKGSLRNNANVLQITGIEGDHDAGTMTPEQAADKLRAANIAGLIYTSPSHTDAKPRWRVLCPLSGPVAPWQREGLLARVNGALAGVLSGESFTLSQSYYFGAVNGNPDHRVILVEGRFLDHAPELDAIAIGKPGGNGAVRIDFPALPNGLEPSDKAQAALDQACELFEDTDSLLTRGRHATVCAATLHVATYIRDGQLGFRDACDAIEAALEGAEGGRELKFDNEISDALKGALARIDGSEFFREVPALSPQMQAELGETFAETMAAIRENVARAEAATKAAKPAANTAERIFTPTPFLWIEPSDIRPREWIYGMHYIRKYLTATIAPGAMGKSSLALVEAVSMALGRDLLHPTGDGKYKPLRQRYRVWYWNGEDPAEETQRRLAAVCLRYGIKRGDLEGYLFTDSGRDSPIIIAAEDRDGLRIARPVTEGLSNALLAIGGDILILDPFVTTHRVSENDNTKISAVVGQFKDIAEAANVSVELLHHVRKGNNDTLSAEDARGAKALVDASRSVRVLSAMSEDQASSLGIIPADRFRYLHIEDGKPNMAPRGQDTAWRHLDSVCLGNARDGLGADFIGVPEAWQPPVTLELVTPEHLAELARRIEAGEGSRANVRAKDWIGHTLAKVMGIIPDTAENKIADEAERKRLAGFVRDLARFGKLTPYEGKNSKREVVDFMRVSAGG